MKKLREKTRKNDEKSKIGENSSKKLAKIQVKNEQGNIKKYENDEIGEKMSKWRKCQKNQI